MEQTSTRKTRKQLILENEELISRLSEAEESLQAIRNGEVDAVVVSGANGEQVYSISSPETPYRTFIEEMHEGAVTLSNKGLILYCNRRFAELVNQPIENVMGSYLNQYLARNFRSKFDQLIAKQALNQNNIIVVSLTNNTFLKLSFHLLPVYLLGNHFVMIATDITEIKKKENELIDLHHSLELNMKQLQSLRIDLINTKIEMDVQIKKLKDENKKLVNDRQVNGVIEL
jgi:PAS domain S-box-containing protein